LAGLDVTTRGRSTALFADVKNTFKNGVYNVNLTTEHKEHIFLMYPAVRYAFSVEVPLQKSETEFWTSYFQSEYYSRDKGTSEGSNILINQSQIDDIFSQYEAQHLNDSSKLHIKQKLSGKVDEDVDLTATFEDYRPPEVRSQLLPLEDRYIDVNDTTNKSSYNSKIIDKYNKHSSILMSATNLRDNPSGSSNDNNKTTDFSPIKKAKKDNKEEILKDTDDSDTTRAYLSELVSQPDPESQYVPLHLAPLPQSSVHNQSHTASNDQKGLSLMKPSTAAEDTAFGISAKAFSGGKSPMLSEYVNTPLIIDSNELFQSILTVWPKSVQAHQVNRTVLVTLKEASQILDESSITRKGTKAEAFIASNASFIQVILNLSITI
jgi:hypothetical protein